MGALLNSPPNPVGGSPRTHFTDPGDERSHHLSRSAPVGTLYVAGIPTYVVMAELALNVLLAGGLSRPKYPDALAIESRRRWHEAAVLSLGYGEAGLRRRGDLTIAMANATRGLVEASHSRLAASKVWVLNEKGIVERAGLGAYAELLLRADDADTLLDAIAQTRGAVEAEPPA